MSEPSRAAGMGGDRERVTACLIVQDEQERLPGALASVAFCDEVIVVDGGSHDRTVGIAAEAGARVIENPWPGFAVQRNIALDAARTEWVLEIDADERISPRLRESILELLAAPPAGADMAVFALRNRFLGGPLGPSAKYPSYRSRLFRRDAYRHDEGRAVHEGIELRERPLILEGDLEHELASSPREAIADLWRYARLDSSHLRRPSSPLAYLKGILLRPAAKLAYRTLIDAGWRDGWRGLAKIALDVVSDALVWTLVLVGAGRAAGAAAAPEAEHFGRRRVGPPKVLAVAAGAAATEEAASWLRRLRAEGFDVALVCDCAGGAGPAGPGSAAAGSAGPGSAGSGSGQGGDGLAVQRLPRLGPLGTIRAIETEMHVRPADAVVAFGLRARLVLRLVPPSLRPQIAGLEPGGAPSGPDSP
ncbi:MAG: glycosyltransferase family 2 protein [Solirubrobacteraceae bacterium]